MPRDLNEILEMGEPRKSPLDPGAAGAQALDAQLDELQKICNYRLVRKSLRPAGIGSIIFGLIAIAMGFGSMDEAPINAVLGLIGIFLLGEGIVSAPRPGGMIVDGIALVILGVWNILITISNAKSGGGGGFHFFAIIGVWQIIWGCQSFGRYARVSQMAMIKPTDEALKKIDDMVKKVLKAKTRDTPDVIEFQGKGMGAQSLWKAQLSQDSAVFVQVGGQDVVFTRKDQVHIETQGKVLIGKALNAEFRFSDRVLKGTIAPDLFDRYEAWKNSQLSDPVNQAGE